jgi:hypothetical protein|tara:strand:- start:1883 stop:2200 length:318 start_codon:yes stop_codon:yes gene_type:complete
MNILRRRRKRLRLVLVAADVLKCGSWTKWCPKILSGARGVLIGLILNTVVELHLNSFVGLVRYAPGCGLPHLVVIGMIPSAASVELETQSSSRVKLVVGFKVDKE